VNSVGNAPVPVSKPQTPVNTVVTGTAHDFFYQFDAWLYGIAGFHISNFSVWILSIFSWLLGKAKEIVDYVLNILRGGSSG